MKKLLIVVCCLFASVAIANSSNSFEPIGCRDENGLVVDWWIILKMSKGYRYIYRDSKSTNLTFNEPKDPLDDPHANNALANTLGAIYANARNPDLAYVVYNDQAPGRNQIAPEADDKAHAKGIVAFDLSQGIWLIHSVPKFLSTAIESENYAGLPKTARQYGQSFLCVTYLSESFQEIGAQLFIDNPRVIQKQIPAHMVPLAGDALYKIANNKVAPIAIHEAQSRVSILSSREGNKIIAFAKSKRWQLDFYQHLLAPYFNTNLLVRTWMRAPGNLPTLCAGTYCYDDNIGPESTCTYLCTNHNTAACRFAYSTMHVNGIRLSDSSVLMRKDDHSKWAISSWDFPKPVVCIGDINTQIPQRSRGGGAACIEDFKTWRAFYDLIFDDDICPS